MSLLVADGLLSRGELSTIQSRLIPFDVTAPEWPFLPKEIQYGDFADFDYRHPVASESERARRREERNDGEGMLRLLSSPGKCFPRISRGFHFSLAKSSQQPDEMWCNEMKRSRRPRMGYTPGFAFSTANKFASRARTQR